MATIVRPEIIVGTLRGERGTAAHSTQTAPLRLVSAYRPAEAMRNVARDTRVAAALTEYSTRTRRAL